MALEADFAATSRYVDFSAENFGTYSVEYAKLLLAVGSEVDVLCKITCKAIDDAVKRKDFIDYQRCLINHTEIVSEEVLIRRYNLAFKPWEEWSVNKIPAWWRSYNHVKHERNARFKDANLEACANAISGLFTLVIYCHKAEKSLDTLEPYPLLLGREKEPGGLLFQSGYSVPNFK